MSKYSHYSNHLQWLLLFCSGFSWSCKPKQLAVAAGCSLIDLLRAAEVLVVSFLNCWSNHMLGCHCACWSNRMPGWHCSTATATLLGAAAAADRIWLKQRKETNSSLYQAASVTRALCGPFPWFRDKSKQSELFGAQKPTMVKLRLAAGPKSAQVAVSIIDG